MVFHWWFLEPCSVHSLKLMQKKISSQDTILYQPCCGPRFCHTHHTVSGFLIFLQEINEEWNSGLHFKQPHTLQKFYWEFILNTNEIFALVCYFSLSQKISTLGSRSGKYSYWQNNPCESTQALQAHSGWWSRTLSKGKPRCWEINC